METVTSYLVEDNTCKYSSEEEEEEDESRGKEEDFQLREEPCVQEEKQSLESSFLYRSDHEVYHFVGQNIFIREGQGSFAASTSPATTALCQYMESHWKELDLKDKVVLEIGSATGLVSIVAALLGAWVTATDLPDALSNLRLNLSKNTRGKCRHTPQVAALSWSFDLERTYPTSVYHYDYVLAADVVYNHNFLNELLAIMRHFCQPGTTILWASKSQIVNDVEFSEKIKKAFDTKLVFEDGDTQIFMATHREDAEEQHVKDVNVNSGCEIQIKHRLGKVEGTEFRSQKEAMLRDKSDNKELLDELDEEEEEEREAESGFNEAEADRLLQHSKADSTDQSSFTKLRDNRDSEEIVNDEDDNEEGEVGESGDDLNEEAAESKEDAKGLSSLIMDDVTLQNNTESEEIVVVDEDEDEDEEKEEEESGDEDPTEEADVSLDVDCKDGATEKQKVKSFSWGASVISSFGKDTYHYVGTDIDIYECIDFHESSDPYGTVMWPAALALCSFLENNRDLVNLEDKLVLELGAGTGLVAIVASLLGAKVTATDLPDFLGNLRANVMRNTRGRSRHLPQISPLTWSFDLGRIYPSYLYRYDFVLAADVVYHHKCLQELLATMSHFCHPRTTIIWANKIRIETDIEFAEKFKKEFDTTLLAEDGDMKIFMGKFKM